MMIKLNKGKELLVVVSKGIEQVKVPKVIEKNKSNAIKSQPISTVVSQGNKITYSIETKETHNVYQWYKNNVKIAGATLSSYTTSTLYASDNGDYYTCSVSNTFF